jgi:hypothetical protein
MAGHRCGRPGGARAVQNQISHWRDFKNKSPKQDPIDMKADLLKSRFRIKCLHKLLAGFGVAMAVLILILLVSIKNSQNMQRMVEKLLHDKHDTLTWIIDLQNYAFKVRIAKTELPRITDIWPIYDASDTIITVAE